VRLFAFSVACALLVYGCSPRTETVAKTPEPAASGLFQVIRQGEKEPTVVVVNQSDADLRLLLNRSDGTTLKLDVGPNSEGKLTVPVGHYDAKVLDRKGRVDSAYGWADIGEYHTYRAAFKVYHDKRDHSFHIGDSAPLTKTTQ